MSISKKALRITVREQIKALTPDRRVSASLQARNLLEEQSAWKNAHSIFFYAPLPDELDVWPLVHDSLIAGKTVCLPRFDSASARYLACEVRNLTTDIAVGQFGVREPAPGCAAVPLNRLDLILVPGIAFDTRGHRLGRGKGFYDKLLADARGLKCGVAFDEQILTEIPIEPHDVPVNCILTPTRWIDPQPGAVLE